MLNPSRSGVHTWSNIFERNSSDKAIFELYLWNLTEITFMVKILHNVFKQKVRCGCIFELKTQFPAKLHAYRHKIK